MNQELQTPETEPKSTRIAKVAGTAAALGLGVGAAAAGIDIKGPMAELPGNNDQEIPVVQEYGQEVTDLPAPTELTIEIPEESGNSPDPENEKGGPAPGSPDDSVKQKDKPLEDMQDKMSGINPETTGLTLGDSLQEYADSPERQEQLRGLFIDLSNKIVDVAEDGSVGYFDFYNYDTDEWGRENNPGNGYLQHNPQYGGSQNQFISNVSLLDDGTIDRSSVSTIDFSVRDADGIVLGYFLEQSYDEEGNRSYHMQGSKYWPAEGGNEEQVEYINIDNSIAGFKNPLKGHDEAFDFEIAVARDQEMISGIAGHFEHALEN